MSLSYNYYAAIAIIIMQSLIWLTGKMKTPPPPQKKFFFFHALKVLCVFVVFFKLDWSLYTTEGLHCILFICFFFSVIAKLYEVSMHRVIDTYILQLDQIRSYSTIFWGGGGGGG